MAIMKSCGASGKNDRVKSPCGHAVVVQGRGEHDHVRAQKRLANHFIIILLHARSLISATHTTDTRMHIHSANVDHLDGVSALFRAALEAVRKDSRGTFLLGLANNTVIFFEVPLLIMRTADRHRELSAWN